MTLPRERLLRELTVRWVLALDVDASDGNEEATDPLEFILRGTALEWLRKVIGIACTFPAKATKNAAAPMITRPVRFISLLTAKS